MLRQSKNPIYGTLIAEGLVAALSARPAAALLVTPFVHLFTGDPGTITPDSVPGDFTEATFTGYAATALTLPLLGPGNFGPNLIGGHQDVTFTLTADISPGETITGYWIDEAASAGSDLYLVEVFDTPVQFENSGDFLTMLSVWPVDEEITVPTLS